MHPSVRSFTLLGLSALLIAALIGFVLTRQTANSAIPKEPARSDEQAQAQLVDQSPLETAHDVSDVASTVEEQKLAAEAIRNADHEVDLAFATALQQTQLHPAVDNTDTRELNARIRTLDSRPSSPDQAGARETRGSPARQG